MNHRIRLRWLLCVASLLPFLAIAGCHSDHVTVTIENHSGAAVQLLELDYPSASFGADQIAAGADFRYRIQVRGTSPVELSYTGPNKKQYKIKGTELADHAQGSLRIVLLPGGKVEFYPMLTVQQ